MTSLQIAEGKYFTQEEFPRKLSEKLSMEYDRNTMAKLHQFDNEIRCIMSWKLLQIYYAGGIPLGNSVKKLTMKYDGNVMEIYLNMSTKVVV